MRMAGIQVVKPSDIDSRTMSKVTWRLVPFLMLCYFIAYLDRVNIGFAGATMRADLNLSATAFGGAAGIFFLAYFFFEVPSNLALNAFGARRWIARIMFTWGIISGAQAFVSGELSFNIVRLLLGVAEAGFFPASFLPDTLVPDRLSRPNCRLVHVRHSDIDGHRSPDFRPHSQSRRRRRTTWLAMDVPDRGFSGADYDVCGSLLSH
jgi:hypothetical protein